MPQHYTQPTHTTPEPQAERVPMTWALTATELDRVVGGGDGGPTGIGDNNGRQ